MAGQQSYSESEVAGRGVEEGGRRAGGLPRHLDAMKQLPRARASRAGADRAPSLFPSTLSLFHTPEGFS